MKKLTNFALYALSIIAEALARPTPTSFASPDAAAVHAQAMTVLSSMEALADEDFDEDGAVWKALASHTFDQKVRQKVCRLLQSANFYSYYRRVVAALAEEMIDQKEHKGDPDDAAELAAAMFGQYEGGDQPALPMAEHQQLTDQLYVLLANAFLAGRTVRPNLLNPGRDPRLPVATRANPVRPDQFINWYELEDAVNGCLRVAEATPVVDARPAPAATTVNPFAQKAVILKIA